MSQNQVYCADHPEVIGAPCATCARPICNDCAAGFARGFQCHPCAVRAGHQQRRRRIATVAGATTLIAAGIGVLVMFAPAEDSAEGALASGPKPAGDELADALAEHLRLDPCNGQVLTDLTTQLAKHERHRDVLRVSYEFLARCGDYPRLRWNISYAHQQLGQYIPEAVTDTAIIADDPRDHDYWRWRAEAWSRAGLPELALADHRQAIANSDVAQMVAIGEFEQAADDAAQPCEAARARRHYVRFLGGPPVRASTRDDALLAASGQCSGEDGRGELRVTIDPATNLGSTSVKIGSAKGTFLFDPFAGTTVVSTAFAIRASLSPRSSVRPQTFAAGHQFTGLSVTADELAAGSARARDVDLLVVNDLPPNVDGILGLSFFWHFDIRVDGNVAILTAPKA